jgi:hypothetical protein
MRLLTSVAGTAFALYGYRLFAWATPEWHGMAQETVQKRLRGAEGFFRGFQLAPFSRRHATMKASR